MAVNDNENKTKVSKEKNDKKTKENNGKKNFFTVIGKVFVDIGRELKRITWPTKEEIKKTTIVVAIFCGIYIVLVGVMEWGCSALFKNLIYKL